MSARLIICALFCSLLLLPLQADSVRAEDQQFSPGDFIEGGVDFGSSVGFTALTIVRQLATFGVNVLNGSRRGLRNLIKNTSGAIKRQAKQNLRRAIKLKKKIIRQRADFKRLSKRIFRIAASGADVPQSLANRAANLARNIARSYQRALEIESTTQQLQASAAGQ